MSNALRKYSLATGCLVFAVVCVTVGALALAVDDTEGTYFVVTVLGSVLGFPSVWSIQELVWGLEESVAGRTSTPFTVIVAGGMVLNWALIGLAGEVVRTVRRRSKVGVTAG